MLELVRERCSEYLAMAIQPSLKDKIHAYAQANDTNDSAAARYILSLFFDGDFQKIKVAIEEMRDDLSFKDGEIIEKQNSGTNTPRRAKNAGKRRTARNSGSSEKEQS